jgi:hypothetical protein
MAFLPIDTNTIKVGDPITKDLWDLIKTNFDDHELRINSLSTSGGSIHIFNGDIDLTWFKITSPDIFYYKAPQEFSVNDFRVQLFSKQGFVAGNLVFDLQKSIDTDDSNFSSILQTSLSFNFASDADYSQKVALIDSGVNTIPADSVLRIKITNIPTGFYGKILVKIGGQ